MKELIEALQIMLRYFKDADEKKELKMVPKHYDIANLQPFDKVLVRDGDGYAWKASLFSHHAKDGWFECVGSIYIQCIPFEGNKHLLGTTEPCGDEYINW